MSGLCLSPASIGALGETRTHTGRVLNPSNQPFAELAGVGYFENPEVDAVIPLSGGGCLWKRCGLAADQSENATLATNATLPF